MWLPHISLGLLFIGSVSIFELGSISVFELERAESKGQAVLLSAFYSLYFQVQNF